MYVRVRIMSMHAQSGTPTSLRKLPYWRMYKSLLAKLSWLVDYGSMRAYLDIPPPQLVSDPDPLQ